MLGLSYGQLFLILGATVALVGKKDLPIIARTAGRIAGRAIGNVQLLRGQFDNVMQQSQASQVQKELQEALAQIDAIRHEMRSVSFMNPGPLTTRVVDNIDRQTPAPSTPVDQEPPKHQQQSTVKVDSTDAISLFKDQSSSTMLSDIHSQATAYSRLAESASEVTDSMDKVLSELTDESGRFIVLPISAESAKLLPNKQGGLKGSDILLEAVVEGDVARNAKDFFIHAQAQKKNE